MANKKYQIFVSSTFVDLKDERQAVSRAILNLGHIPAGMELFPAADLDQMSFIRKVIDDCDYYILITGGRYGSVSDTGLSYTEMEYEYAVEKGKPVLAFLHRSSGDLLAKNVDSDKEKLEKLEEFKKKVLHGRLVEYWTSIENLESKALLSLTNAFNDQPQVGWRRDTGELNAEAQQMLNKMRERYDFVRDRFEQQMKRANQLEAKLNAHEALEDSEVEVRYTNEDGVASTTNINAESVIREFAPLLSEGLSLGDIKAGLLEYIYHKVNGGVSDIAPQSVRNIALFLEVFEICSVAQDGVLKLSDDKKWLLKAAFKPLKRILEEMPDDIPF